MEARLDARLAILVYYKNWTMNDELPVFRLLIYFAIMMAVAYLAVMGG